MGKGQLSQAFPNLKFDPGCRTILKMFNQPATIQFSLPVWLTVFIQQRPFIIKDVRDRMGFVIEASRRNIQEKTGGPFAAALFEIGSGKLISLGVNLVTTQGLSIVHAEIVAIAVAQRKWGTYDLGKEGNARNELVTSTEPCAMCLGAIPWSGVHRVVTGAKGIDATRIGFDEGSKVRNWRIALAERHIEVIVNVKRFEACEVLNEYSRSGGRIYNPSKSS